MCNDPELRGISTRLSGGGGHAQGRARSQEGCHGQVWWAPLGRTSWRWPRRCMPAACRGARSPPSLRPEAMAAAGGVPADVSGAARGGGLCFGLERCPHLRVPCEHCSEGRGGPSFETGTQLIEGQRSNPRAASAARETSCDTPSFSRVASPTHDPCRSMPPRRFLEHPTAPRRSRSGYIPSQVRPRGRQRP